MGDLVELVMELLENGTPEQEILGGLAVSMPVADATEVLNAAKEALKELGA